MFVEQLRACATAAADVVPSAMGDDELAEALVTLHRLQAQLAAVGARLTSAFDARRAWADDGSRSAAAWLAHRCRIPAAEARAEVRLARRLRTLPATASDLAAGEIGVAHARRLAELASDDRSVALVRDEAMLVQHARTLSWADFARATAYWRQLADPDGCEAATAHADDHRRVHLSPGLDGTGLLDGQLTPLGRATVGGALDRIERELFEADWAEARGERGEAATLDDLARTPAQRRHDALVTMAERATAAPPGARRPAPLVTVLVDGETFAGRVCELADGTVLAPGVVARLLDRALVERIVFDGPDRVLGVGHARLFTGALRRAVEVRDRHCTHPGCDVPAERCEVDHVVPHADGGPTALANATLLCPRHHRWRHRVGAAGSPPPLPGSRSAPASPPGPPPDDGPIRRPAAAAGVPVRPIRAGAELETDAGERVVRVWPRGSTSWAGADLLWPWWDGGSGDDRAADRPGARGLRVQIGT